jgi:Peptidase family C25
LSSNAQAVIPVSLPAIAGSAAEELRVIVHGATEHPEQPHRVELRWNGQSVGVFDLSGRQRHTITVPLGGLTAGLENELVVQQHVTGDAPPVLYVDAAEVDYVRFAIADGPVFRFGPAEAGACSLTGLVSDAAHLYDLTDPARPKNCGEVLLNEPGRLSFTAENVYWEFANGEPDPLAIRDFLAFTRQQWLTPPRFAALIGKGSLDYRDLMGLAGNWLPAALAPTDGGLFPSDSNLGDVEGDDGAPEIAIGRFPVTSAEELHRMIAAIPIRFEPHSPKRRLLRMLRRLAKR